MNDFVKILTNARRLKAATKKADSSELEKAYGDLAEIIEARRLEEAEMAHEEEEKKALKAAILAQMEDAGLDVTDLVEQAPTKARKRKAGKSAKRKIKYRFTDKSGEEHTWAGVGRAPKVFAELKAQNKLEKYRVDEA